MKSSLPDLPRILKKKEASYTPRVLQWFRENGPACCAIEIKVAKDRRTVVPESALLPHQKRALLDACGNGIVWKIPDEARRQLPFDAFKIASSYAFVVCVFPVQRRVVIIDVREWRGCTSASPCYASFKLG